MKIAVTGAAGRMGRAVLKELSATKGVEIAGALEHAGHPDLGKPVQEAPHLVLSADAEKVFKDSHAVIDFTTPAATVCNADLSARLGTILVAGTTGLSHEQQKELAHAAQSTVIVHAPNMSLGMNLLLALVEKATRALDESFDIEILEAHHRMKADAPSGSALALGRAAATGRSGTLEGLRLPPHDGPTGPRKAGGIGFSVIRGGDIVGDHTVLLAGEAEQISLSHRATDRRVFARGAVRAALWAGSKPPGLYTMQDVLDL